MIHNKKLIKNNKKPQDTSVCPRPISYGMRILIGTPVHECKDYAMEKWLKSVSKFDYPFDLFMVDNSENPGYVDKLHEYCKKYGITNYKLTHIDIGPNVVLDERLAKAREVIRQEMLSKNYDAWCTLECDIIAPPDALTKLVGLMEDNWMVCHTYPARGNSNDTNAEFGISMVKRKLLEDFCFTTGYGYANPLQPNCWYSGDVWFIRRLDQIHENKHMTIGGIIKPIYHLAQ